LFCLLIAVNAGLIVPHCDLDACSITGYQESGPEYLEGSSHGLGSPTLYFLQKDNIILKGIYFSS